MDEKDSEINAQLYVMKKIAALILDNPQSEDV